MVLLAGAVLPLAAFYVGMAAGDPVAAHASVVWRAVPASVPLHALFVSLPALLPVAVARGRRARSAVLGVMVLTAGAAGFAVVATDDAQAGLAVFLVGYVAFPLAVAILVGRVTWRWLGGGSSRCAAARATSHGSTACTSEQ